MISELKIITKTNIIGNSARRCILFMDVVRLASLSDAFELMRIFYALKKNPQPCN